MKDKKTPIETENNIAGYSYGQVIIVSLLLFFVALVIVSTLLGPIVIFTDFAINQTANATNSELIATLLNFIPVFIVLVLIIALFLIVSNR